MVLRQGVAIADGEGAGDQYEGEGGGDDDGGGAAKIES